MYSFPNRNFSVDLTDEVIGRKFLPSALGTFSDVWKCVKCGGGFENYYVAVKALRIRDDDDLIAQKAEKLQSKLCQWTGLKHEAVLPILGFVNGLGPLPAPVSRWLDGGNLTHYLKANPDMSLDQRLHLLQRIAEGLHYLHSQGILHGNLNGSNILLDTKGSPYIADYGIFPLILELNIPRCISTPVGPGVRWAAPDPSWTPLGEDRSNNGLSFEGDVYSFGSVMLQVLTGRVPYHYIERDEEVIFTFARGLRPDRPQDIADGHWDFIQKCWAPNPEGRPSALELVTFFHQQCLT
ncbi:kinase-like domain-containing protein, partial [Pisolithus marmoratus]